MKKRPSCPTCGRAFRRGARVFVATGGSLERKIVCSECAARAVSIVVPDAPKAQRDLLMPFAEHLLRLAKAYDGTERAEGLRQAADILAEARDVPVAARSSQSEREPRVEVSTAAMLAIRAEEERGRPHERIDCWCGRKHASPATNGKAHVPKLSKCEHAILTALVQKKDSATRAELAILAGYSSESGSFAKALANLRAAGHIGIGSRMSTGSGSFVVTSSGIAAAGVVQPLPRGAELLEYWCGRVGPCGAAILQTLSLAWPAPVERDELAQTTGYSANSGSFAKALAQLRTLELVDGFALSVHLARAADLGAVDRAEA